MLVLLHGLGRTSRSMRRLAAEGSRRGYQVVNLSYRSRHAGVLAHAKSVALALSELRDAEPLHLVTHSMGGMVLRAAVANGWLPAARVGRAVMLAPPNGGSELAEWLCRTPLFRLAVGPAGPELRIGAEGIASTLPEVQFELGVIAGTTSRAPIVTSLFRGPHDGKVSVERAMVAGMRDFLVVRAGHTFIMNSPEVTRQAFHFLTHGSFDRP